MEVGDLDSASSQYGSFGSWVGYIAYCGVKILQHEDVFANILNSKKFNSISIQYCITDNENDQD